MRFFSIVPPDSRRRQRYGGKQRLDTQAVKTLFYKMNLPIGHRYRFSKFMVRHGSLDRISFNTPAGNMLLEEEIAQFLC